MKSGEVEHIGALLCYNVCHFNARNVTKEGGVVGCARDTLHILCALYNDGTVALEIFVSPKRSERVLVDDDIR